MYLYGGDMNFQHQSCCLFLTMQRKKNGHSKPYLAASLFLRFASYLLWWFEWEESLTVSTTWELFSQLLVVFEEVQRPCWKKSIVSTLDELQSSPPRLTINLLSLFRAWSWRWDLSGFCSTFILFSYPNGLSLSSHKSEKFLLFLNDHWSLYFIK